MIRIPTQFSALLLFGVVGCVADTPFGSQRFKVVGMALESAVPGVFVCSDLSDTSLRGEPLVRAIEIRAGDLVETEEIVQLSARQRKSGVFFNYSVLMGPNPLSGETVSGWFENSEPTVRLASTGWVYLEGEQPRSKTEWVSAAAEGSAIVLQRATGSLQRVFFLDGLQANIACIQDDSISSALNAVGTYIDIGPGCAFSAPIQIDVPATPSDVQSFIDYVRAAAAACGLTP